MRRNGVAIGLVSLLACAAAAGAFAYREMYNRAAADPAGADGRTGHAQEIDAAYVARFTDDGQLRRPEGWEAWVLAGTSMGLTYDEPGEAAANEPPGSFLNVYIQPWAYERFMTDGAFPEGTMFILAGSEPVRKAEPARGGFYQGDLHLMEVHLKREGIDPTGWAFFGYGADTEAAAPIPGSASCYQCHSEHADFDNVFVQFYPRMRERLGMEPRPAGGE